MPNTELREVRQNARVVVHRTYDGGGRPTTVCDERLDHLTPDPRHWRGSENREITECTTCFAPEATDDEIKPGDMVTLTASVGLPSNPRGWTAETVYVYVGPTRHYANRAIVLCENGWRVADNLDRMPVESEAAGLATARMEAWSVQAEGMAHAPADYDEDDLPPRIRRARNRLIATRPAEAVPNPPGLEQGVRLCEMGNESGHPDTPHCHTSGNHPLWGDPTSADSGNRLRHPDNSYVLFAKGAHAPATTPEFPVEMFTESETQPVPEHPHPVGTDIYPLSYEKLSTFPRGSVLTVRSRPRGQLANNYLQFGCQSWRLETLAREHATVEFTTTGVVVTADVTTNTNFEEVTAAGNRINLGEFNNYAASVIVKEIAVVPVMNALVMEHGFYGCAVHPGEVIFVGNGHPGNREPVAPVVGKVHPVNAESNRMTGTVGQTAGLRQTTFVDCTPVVSPTTATTMHLVRSRSWALVPATPEQITRMQALPRYRCALAATTSDVVVACSSEGVPSAAPAEAVPVF